MVELTAWLYEQLDVDAAEIAVEYGDKTWHARNCDALPDILYPDRETYPCDCGVPARLLREIEAKRGALAHYEQVRQHTRQGDAAYVLAEGAVAKQIQFMATGYDQRPGYREDWRP
ncbi:DUF6221 family protein [Streptomyces sp. NBC_00620]|uniref:DUF6221 family protein n=1 Tax=Streptomyces sp. NBC_00620 TaxID=2903666 RepID=UPI0022596697|nr:DUF6221 family protein [Streptomyces sp. NBC_00620]MCX4974228.1 DUF6221 family protein [Streptomyces sp. NBC_00620]